MHKNRLWTLEGERVGNVFNAELEGIKSNNVEQSALGRRGDQIGGAVR